jgi:hypothetical protein
VAKPAWKLFCFEGAGLGGNLRGTISNAVDIDRNSVAVSPVRVHWGIWSQSKEVRMNSHGHGIVFGILVACLAGSGCTSLYKPQRVRTLEEAGSTHMAVLSVAPWTKYRDAIQPQFTLTADSAFQQVLPNTADYEQKLLDAVDIEGKLGLPSTSASATTTTHKWTGVAPTVKSDVTRTEAPGDTSKITFAAAPASGNASGLPGSTLGNALGFDPMMKYWAALALYQEVQLINRYLKDAAIRDNFVPYLVRLQVTFMPRMRDEPYDVYSAISFFAKDFPVHIDFSGSKKRKPPSATHLMTTELGTHKNPWTGATSTNDLIIIPLLVTDDIETAMESRSVERVQKFAFALQALVHGVSAAADVQSLHDKLQSVLAHDYNSQFTVARASENTLRIRFGAAQQATAHYAAIPQTHNVTFLLLSPKQNVTNNSNATNRLVRLVSKMTIMDAETGAELPANQDYQLGEIREALRCHEFTQHFDEEQISLLSRCIYANDYQSFDKIIGQPGKGFGGIHFRDALWADLATLHGLNQYQTATLELPPYPPMITFEPQTPILTDDIKSGMTAAIGGVVDVNPNEITARLEAELKSNATVQTRGHLSLSATSLAINEATHQLIVTFPSAAALGRGFDGQPSIQIIRLPDPFIRGSNTHEKVGTFRCFYVSKTPAQITYRLSSNAKLIVSDKGQGKLQVRLDIDKTEQGVTLALEGANVAGATTVPIDILSTNKDNVGKIVITKSGVVTLNLFNLNSSVKVTLKVTDEIAKTTAPDLTLRVVETSSKDEKSAAADAPRRQRVR